MGKNALFTHLVSNTPCKTQPLAWTLCSSCLGSTSLCQVIMPEDLPPFPPPWVLTPHTTAFLGQHPPHLDRIPVLRSGSTQLFPALSKETWNALPHFNAFRNELSMKGKEKGRERTNLHNLNVSVLKPYLPYTPVSSSYFSLEGNSGSIQR